MNTLKRTLALVATLAMATTAFASCGGNEEKEETKTEATTAATEAEEFQKIYELEVVIVPTNKPVLRVDNVLLKLSKHLFIFSWASLAYMSIVIYSPFCRL